MRKPILAVLLLVSLLAALLLPAINLPAQAQSGPGFSLAWHVIGGGGAPISSAHYAVNATIGQGAASPPTSTGANYAVSGGFWYRVPGALYLPVVMKQ